DRHGQRRGVALPRYDDGGDMALAAGVFLDRACHDEGRSVCDELQTPPWYCGSRTADCGLRIELKIGCFKSRPAIPIRNLIRNPQSAFRDPQCVKVARWSNQSGG